MVKPGPVFALDTNCKEFFVEKIVNSRRHGCKWQYLVCYVGFGPEHDKWFSGRELENNSVGQLVGRNWVGK
ncbi:hypothetical protein J132_07679 [Termitomyces sp. J132]|nr:hypothetical protein J132_07679 [Termitomyces sp. J132]